MDKIVIVGAGPAGLAAAYELTRRNATPVLLEKSASVGGISRTETFKGYRFDIGGHRFFTTNDRIQDIWQKTLGPNLLTVKRDSRIFYHGKLFRYPLSLSEALSKLGPLEGIKVLGSYAKATLRPIKDEETLEPWLINRFGDRLYRIFFKTYTEKIWGTPCHTIGSEWSAQRIKGLSLKAALSSKLKSKNNIKTLISEFLYPSEGPGMMWERLSENVRSRGCKLRHRAEVTGIQHRKGKIISTNINIKDTSSKIPRSFLISSMPLPQLIESLDPPPPLHVVEAAKSLRFRALLMVGLILPVANLFPCQWIYIHSPQVQVGRIQNFKNWSAKMVPNKEMTSLGMEYFCSKGDEIWSLDDEELVELAAQELGKIGLLKSTAVQDGIVFRQSMAYPVYDCDYHGHLSVLKGYLASFENLQTIGRNGMHRYNNMDHSMLTGILAAERALGAPTDVWSVNEDAAYLEHRMQE